jgi:hypothetical protein
LGWRCEGGMCVPGSFEGVCPPQGVGGQGEPSAGRGGRAASGGAPGSAGTVGGPGGRAGGAGGGKSAAGAAGAQPDALVLEEVEAPALCSGQDVRIALELHGGIAPYRWMLAENECELSL